MKLLLAAVGALCGIALVIELSTGTLHPFQVAGFGIILACLAAVAPG